MTIPVRSSVGGSIDSFDFTTAMISAGAYTLPSWMAIACATTGRTSQQSASTIRTGYGANAARARSVDGAAFGLSVESARANQSPHDASAWPTQAGTVAISAATDPAGASTNVVFNDTDAAVASFRGEAITATAGTICVSAWTKNTTAQAGTINSNLTDIANAGAIPLTGGDTDWVRREVAGTTAGGSHFAVVQPRIIDVQTGPVSVYSFQMEAGLYPGSAIGPGVSRAADVLSLSSPALVAPGGFFDATIVVAPNYTQAEQGSDHDLLFFDTNNRVFVKASDHKIYLRIGGVDVVSSALTWSRNQAITVHASHLAAGRALVVSGATSGNGTTTGTAVAAITLPATAYVLGNASGAQECSDLRALGFVA